MLDSGKLKLMYLRLSKEDDDIDGKGQESFSIGSQRLLIQQYVESHSELGKYSDFEEIIDDGYSGTNFNRPGAARLLKLVEAEQVETIIVKDLSRFARNYLQAGHFLEFVFPAYDVRFISINDNYDSRAYGESTGGLQLAVRNLINQLYSKDISRKIKSTVDMKKLNGEYVYGAVPYGYRKGEKKNTIIVDSEAAEVVQKIFQWASEGITVSQIARRLNTDGIQTPSMYLKKFRGNYRVSLYWSFDSVKNILINRIYTGDTVPFKSHVVRVGSDQVKLLPEDEQLVIPNTHEAIISREMFFQSRKVIKSNVKSKSQGPSSLFSTYLKCGCCGNKLHKGRKSNQTFRCATARYALDSDCANVHIQEKRLAEVILRAIQNQCDVVDAKVQTARAARKGALSEQTSLQNELQKQKRRVEKSQTQVMRDYEAYISGNLTKEAFLQRKAVAKEVEAEAGIQVVLLTKQLEQLSAEAKSIESMLQATDPLCRHIHVRELTPELLKEFVQSITVYPGGVINIMWNYRDSYSIPNMTCE